MLFLVYSLFFTGTSSPVTDELDLVCVETGETYSLSMEQINTLPAKNPDTGKYTLLPYEMRDGQKVVLSRYLAALGDFKDANKYVDQASGRVLESPRNSG